ncbi:hypothetical protein HY640_02400 [Candidatus Woesearchaeota archaeon]|nr:hypothetical protein [Candidatus Woesearchaeota archaeon]
MAYIRKNVNLFLIMLTIVTLGIMAGLTTYYQVTYKNVSLSYAEKLDLANQLNYNLSVQRGQLSEANRELKLKTEVKEQFDVLYTNVTDYSERVSLELAQTKTELIQTLSELRQKEAELQTAESELTSTKGALKTQQDYSKDLEIQVSSLRSQVCSLRQRLNETC